MTIASRTPEGLPNHFPICGRDTVVEPSIPPGDAPCPSCGQLLWWFQEHISTHYGIGAERINAATLFVDVLGSLEDVELVMALEEEFDINISDEDAEQIRTVGDAIAYIERRTSGGMSSFE